MAQFLTSLEIGHWAGLCFHVFITLVSVFMFPKCELETIRTSVSHGFSPMAWKVLQSVEDWMPHV